MFIEKEKYENMAEFWANVKVRKTDGSFYDLEDYEISNFGNVRKLQNGVYKEIYSREITVDDKDGYRKINIAAKYSGRVLTLRLDDVVMSSIFPQFYKPLYKVYHVDNDVNNCSIYNLYLGRPSEGRKPKECVELPYDLPYEPSDDDILETASNYNDAADFESGFHDLFCWACCKGLMSKIKYKQVSVEPDDIDADDEIESGFKSVEMESTEEFDDEPGLESPHPNPESPHPNPESPQPNSNMGPIENESVTEVLSLTESPLPNPESPQSDSDMGPVEKELVDDEPDHDPIVPDPDLDLLDHTSIEIDTKQKGVKFELKITAHDAETLLKALGDLTLSIRDGQIPNRRSSNIRRDDSGCRYRFDGSNLILNVSPASLTDEEMINIASHYSSRKVFRRQQYTMYTYCVRRGIASKLKFKDEL